MLVIGQWTPRLLGDDRPVVYRIVLQLLSHQDAALQLAAVSTLQAMVDDWDFREDQFVPVAGAAFAALAPVLQAAEDYDAQLQARSRQRAFCVAGLRLFAMYLPLQMQVQQCRVGSWEPASGLASSPLCLRPRKLIFTIEAHPESSSLRLKRTERRRHRCSTDVLHQ